uniref:Uncharacterized protein n=1 Tax=Trichobilharzia regenti TaxID=157069 RepID=A0AA85IQ26_TRIRE|nr:unnamed protein product [Trichobilharzia regenti]
MIEKHCLILAFVWTLFQLSHVLCNELSPVQNNELDTLIKRYSEIYGSYKSAECVALLAVRTPEIDWKVEDFNDVITDTKYQTLAKNVVEYLNKLKDDSYWKNVNGLSQFREEFKGYTEDVEKNHNRNAVEDIGSELGHVESKIDLTTVYDNLVKSLENAWTARKDLYATAAVNYAAANMLKIPEVSDANELTAGEDLGNLIEKDFIQSRENVEEKCLRMSGMQLDQNAANEILTKSDSTSEPVSEFRGAVAQLISEVEKVEKLRIDRLSNQTPLSIANIAVNAMFREAYHKFGQKEK